jgi:hypothetical protein
MMFREPGRFGLVTSKRVSIRTSDCVEVPVTWFRCLQTGSVGEAVGIRSICMQDRRGALVSENLSELPDWLSLKSRAASFSD